MAKVKHDDLWEAFEFVSSAAPMEHSAYISLDVVESNGESSA
jgi:hypothetical protein